MSARTECTSSVWRVDGSQARVTCGAFSAAVDVATPARGLTQLMLDDAPIDGSLLAIELDAEPTDAYARGDDLVVAYHESTARPFSVQVYWSLAGRADALVVLDVTVSLQTRQWEIYPQVAVSSELTNAEMATIAPLAAVIRPRDKSWSYVECGLAGDFAARHATGAARTQWMFADHFMERGVIRRLRLRGALVPRANDEALAMNLAAALGAEQPPLTA